MREPTECGVEPFRWWVFDGWCPPWPDLVRLPVPSSDCWEARYDNDCERAKLTTRKAGWLSFLTGDLFPTMEAHGGEWRRRLGYPVRPDPTMHGGGLHVMLPGGHLSTHLDYDAHPLVAGERRALNLIAFLNPEWRAEWGGGLQLCDPMGEVKKRILPAPGRMVAFEVGDTSYHGVGRVADHAPPRVTAAVYYLSPAGPANTRRRALFIPNRNAA